MRDRLLVALVALTFGVVAVLLVVRGHATASLVHAQEEREVERSAEVIADLVGASRVDVTEELLQSVLYDGEHAVYVDAAGGEVVAATHTSGDPVHKGGDIVVTRSVEGGGTLTVARDAEVVDERVADALLPLVLLALGLAAAAGGVAVWLARRFSRPFTELAEVAGHIGRGDFHVRVPRYTMPEADALARALRASAADLDVLVRRERDFAAHASHQLRTPITATRLELEDLALSPQTPPEVVSRLADALAQLDRLSTTVGDMLDATRESRVGTSVDIDLAALVRDAVGRWGGRAAADRGADRVVVAECDGVLPVRMPVGSLLQVMDVLIANAVTHGEGTVTVTVSDSDAYAEVRVADEGPHDRAVEGAKRPAVGGAGSLATAAEIVEALGGRLRLTDEPSTTFSLVLPHGRRETVV